MNAISEQMAVAQIVLDHSECAAVFQRHRIDYCCNGELTLAAACRRRGTDLPELLSELKQAIAARGDRPRTDLRSLPTEALIQHLLSRQRYLREALPSLVALGAKVARVHGDHNPALPRLRDSLNELAESLSAHLEDEEHSVFPALRTLKAKDDVAALLTVMREDHAGFSRLLEQLELHSDGFTLPDWACTSYRTLFRELQALRDEVFGVVHLEQHVLAPRFTQEVA